MKNTYYFPHDYHARHDPKLERLFLKLGYEGIGIYWCLIEMMYEQGGYLNLTDITLYARGDTALSERLASVIKDFGLFKTDDIQFWSESCITRLTHTTEKREKAAISGSLGGKISGNARRIEANAKRTLSERTPIKESKVKENKEEESNRTLSFDDFWKEYPKQVGMSMAIQTYLATVKTDQDHKDLMSALNNYKQSKDFKGGYIKNGSNWIEDWRGWIPKKRITPVITPTQVSAPAPFVQPTAEDRAKLSALVGKIGK